MEMSGGVGAGGIGTYAGPTLCAGGICLKTAKCKGIWGVGVCNEGVYEEV